MKNQKKTRRVFPVLVVGDENYAPRAVAEAVRGALPEKDIEVLVDSVRSSVGLSQREDLVRDELIVEQARVSDYGAVFVSANCSLGEAIFSRSVKVDNHTSAHFVYNHEPCSSQSGRPTYLGDVDVRGVREGFRNAGITESLASRAGVPFRVLLAEQDRGVRMLLEDSFALPSSRETMKQHVGTDVRLLFYPVTAAQEARDLLEASYDVRRKTFALDIVVSCLILKGGNGSQVLDYVRSRSRHIPFLLCSGSEIPQEVYAHAPVILSKPFLHASFEAKLAEALNLEE